MAESEECEDGGYLVGMEFPIPEDVSVRYRGGREFVGCNRIFCPTCQSWVRHADRRQLGQRPATRAAHEWLYDNLQTAGEPTITTRPGFGAEVSRVYVCRCNTMDGASLLTIAYLENEWYCAGHPAAGG